MDTPVAQSAKLEEAQRKINESESFGINSKTSGSETPGDSSMHHKTSMNSPVVWPCWRPKQDGNVGGDQNDAFPSGDSLNTGGEMRTSSVSPLSEEISHCGLSVTALSYDTREGTDKQLQEEPESRPVMKSSFVSDSISGTIGKDYEDSSEILSGSSKTEDVHIGQMILECTKEEIDTVVGLIYRSEGGDRDSCSSKVVSGSNVIVNPQVEELCGVNDSDSSCKEGEGRNEEVLCGDTVTCVTDGHTVSTDKSIDSVHDSVSGGVIKGNCDDVVRDCNVQDNLGDMVRGCLRINCRCNEEGVDCSWIRRNNVRDVKWDHKNDGKSKVDSRMLSDICNDILRNDGINNQTDMNTMEIRNSFSSTVVMDVGNGVVDHKYDGTKKRDIECSASGEHSQMLDIRSYVIESNKTPNQNASESSNRATDFDEFHKSGKIYFENPHSEALPCKETPEITNRCDLDCHNDYRWAITYPGDNECSEAIPSTSKCNDVLQSDNSCVKIISSVSNCNQAPQSGSDCTEAPQHISRFDHVLQGDSVHDEIILTASNCDHTLSVKIPHSFGEFGATELSRCNSWIHTNQIALQKTNHDINHLGTENISSEDHISQDKVVGSFNHMDDVCFSRKRLEEGVMEVNSFSQGQDEIEFDCDCCTRKDAVVKNRDGFNVVSCVTHVESGGECQDVTDEEVLCDMKYRRNGQPYTLRDCDREDNKVVEGQVANNERLQIMASSESNGEKTSGIGNSTRVCNTNEKCSSDGFHGKSMSGQSIDWEGKDRNSMEKDVILKSDGKEWEWESSKAEANSGGIDNTSSGNQDDSSGIEKGDANRIKKEDGSEVEKNDGSGIENMDGTGSKGGDSGFEKAGANEIEDGSGIENYHVSMIGSSGSTRSKGDDTRKDDSSRVKKEDGSRVKEDGCGIENDVCKFEEEVCTGSEIDGSGIEKDDGSSIEKDNGIVVEDTSRTKKYDGSIIKKEDGYRNQGEKSKYIHISIEKNNNETSNCSGNRELITENYVHGSTMATEHRGIGTAEKFDNDKVMTSHEKNDHEIENLTGNEDVSYIPKNVKGVSLVAVDMSLSVQESNMLDKELEIVGDENVHVGTGVNQDEVDGKMDLDKLDYGAVSNKVDPEDGAACVKMEMECETNRDSMNFDDGPLGRRMEDSKDRIVLEELQEIKSSENDPQELSKGDNGTVNVELKGEETSDKKLEANGDMIFSGTGSLEKHVSSGTDCFRENINSVEDDNKTDKLDGSDDPSDEFGISRSSNNSTEEPEILRGLSSPSYEPEIIINTCSPSEEPEILRGRNNPSDTLCQGLGRNSKKSGITGGMESTKRKRNTHESKLTDIHVKTPRKLYRPIDDSSVSSHGQNSHFDVIIDMINTVKEKVLSLEQQRHQVQKQESCKAADTNLQELRDSQVMNYVEDHPLTTKEDLSSKNSLPIEMRRKNSHENQVKGKVSCDKIHSQQMHLHPHTQGERKDLEKKLSMDEHLSEAYQTEERPSCSSKDVLQLPSLVQQDWKHKDIKTPLDFTKLLSKMIEQLKKLKQSTQTPSFKIQALVYQLYIGLQEHQENTIEEQHHAPPPQKKQRLLQQTQKSKRSIPKEKQVHQLESLVNRNDINQKDSEHELQPCLSVQQKHKDFSDEKIKESEEMTKPTATQIVDGELCHFAPDLNVGSLLSGQQQRSVSILRHEEVIETDCVSTLLKEMERDSDLFFRSGNSDQKLSLHEDEAKGQSLALPDHHPGSQGEITILREFVRPGEASVNYSVLRRPSLSIDCPEESPAAKKQNDFNISPGKPTLMQKRNIHCEARLDATVACAEMTKCSTVKPIYTVAPGTSKAFSLPNWAMSGVHVSQPCALHARPSINIFPPQGQQVVPSSLQAPNPNAGIAYGLKPCLKNRLSQGHSSALPESLLRLPSLSVVKNPPGIPSTTTGKLRPAMSLGPTFYTPVKMPKSRQRNTPLSSYVYDKKKTVTFDQKNLQTKPARKKKDAMPVLQPSLPNSKKSGNVTEQRTKDVMPLLEPILSISKKSGSVTEQRTTPTQTAVTLQHLLSETKKDNGNQISDPLTKAKASQTRMSSLNVSQCKWKSVGSAQKENKLADMSSHEPGSIGTSLGQSEGSLAQYKLIKLSPTSQCEMPTEVNMMCLPQTEPPALECEISESQGTHSAWKDEGSTLGVMDTNKKNKPYNLRNVSVASVVQSSWGKEDKSS